MRPFLLVTGRSVHVPRMAIPVASAATLFVLLHTAKKYHQGSKRLLMKRLFIGIFSRLFVIALTASAGYLLVTFYPDFNSNSSALNFVTGMHRGLLSAIILFVTGASITIWGVFPLVPIPVSILEGSLLDRASAHPFGYFLCCTRGRCYGTATSSNFLAFVFLTAPLRRSPQTFWIYISFAGTWDHDNGGYHTNIPYHLLRHSSIAQ